MLKSAAPSAGATDSFFSLVRDHTARRVCAQRAALRSDREWHERNFPLQGFAVRNRTGGQAIVAPRIAGERQHRCQSTAAFRGKSVGRLKAADETASCRNDKEVVVKGRMMLFVASILACQFSPIHLTPSAADQTGVASVYSHESGSGTASGQKLNREAFTAAHRTLPFGTKVKVTNQSNGRSVIVTINDRGPFVRGRVIDVTPAAARMLGFSGLTQVAINTEQ
jgi:rare lipoprotein A